MRIQSIFTTETGLTLVELMIVLVLSLVLMAAVYMAYHVQHTSAVAQERVLTAQQDVRAIMDIMERDIRLAGCDPNVNPLGLVGITDTTGASATDTRLGLIMDLDGNRNTTGPDEVVSYRWNALTRTLTRNGAMLSGDVTNLLIVYTSFGTDLTPGIPGQLGSNASRVRTIELTVQVRGDKPDPDTGIYAERQFTRKVDGRNLGL